MTTELRERFAKRQDPRFFLGRTMPQLVFGLLGLLCVVFFLRSVLAKDTAWWWLVGVAVAGPLTFGRVHGRTLASTVVMRLGHLMLAVGGQRSYRGGPHRHTQPVAPGALSKLQFRRYQVGGQQGEVGMVVDTSDGTVTVVAEVAGPGLSLCGTEQVNAFAVAFGAAANAVAQEDSAIRGIQLLERIAPDTGDAGLRELARRHRGPTDSFAYQVNVANLNHPDCGGITNRSYIAVRVDPRRAKAQLQQLGGLEGGGDAAVTWQQARGFTDGLSAAGVQVVGWLPVRGIGALIRSAFDPAADESVARRGGGAGDLVGGHQGLPSGVDPSFAWPTYAEPYRSFYAHNDQTSRCWWIDQYPRGDNGAPVGFLEPILAVAERHTVTVLLTPLSYRQATRRLEREIDNQDSRRRLKARFRRRRKRADTREEIETDLREAELDDGSASYRWATVVTATAPNVLELEIVSGQIESALNRCALEWTVWYGETDQMFYAGALPLARGI